MFLKSWRPVVAAQSFQFWAFLVLGGPLFLIQKLQNSKKLRLINDILSLIYLPITKSPGLLAPTAENPAMNYELK
jgi:hypothetical protein